MISLVGLALTFLLVEGGGLIERGQTVLGLVLVGTGAMGFGLLIAALQTSRRNAALIDGVEMPEGLSVARLVNYAWENDIDPTAAVYVGDQGLNVAGSVFYCLLDGRRALVIERKSE